MSNDNFSNATVISGKSGAVAGSNFGATSESGEPGSSGSTVWWAWTAPITGDFYFSTRGVVGSTGTDFKSKVQVFTANNPSSPVVSGLTQVSYLEDQRNGIGNGFEFASRVAFQATAATVYYIRVDSRLAGSQNQGNICLKWDEFYYERLGCNSCVDFTVTTECYSAVLRVSGFVLPKVSFGSFPRRAGQYSIQYCGGYLANVNYADGFQWLGLITTNATGQNFVAGGPQDTFWRPNIIDSINSRIGFVAATGGPSGATSIVFSDEYGAIETASGWRLNPSVSASYGIPHVSFLDDTSVVGSFGAGGNNDATTFETSLACAAFSFVSPGGEISIAAQDNPVQSSGNTALASATFSPNVMPQDQGPILGDIKLDLGLTSSPYGGIASFTGYNKYPDSQTGRGIYVPDIQAGDFFSLSTTSKHYFDYGNVARWTSTGKLPIFKLSYTSIISTLSQGALSLSNTGASFSGTFTIVNNSSIAWSGVTITLLNQGGISGASAPQTKDIPANTSTTISFTWTSAASFTAFLQIDFNGVDAGTLSWLVAPVISCQFVSKQTGLACASPLPSINRFNLKVTNSGLGKTSNLVAVVNPSDGRVLLTGAAGNPCTNVYAIPISIPIGTVGANGGTANFQIYYRPIDGATSVTFTVSLSDDNGSYPPFQFTATI